jgi:hypothetical protein
MVGELRLTKKIFVSAQIRDLWHTVRDGMHFIHFEHHDLIITAPQDESRLLLIGIYRHCVRKYNLGAAGVRMKIDARTATIAAADNT